MNHRATDDYPWAKSPVQECAKLIWYYVQARFRFLNSAAKLQLIFDMCKFFGTFFSKKFSKGGKRDGNGWFEGVFGNGGGGIKESRNYGITEGGNSDVRDVELRNYGSGFLVEFRIGEDLRTVLQ